MKNKSLFLIVMSVVMCLASLGFLSLFSSSTNVVSATGNINASNPAVWDGLDVDHSYDGDGTFDNPYIIDKATEFVGLAEVALGGDPEIEKYNQPGVYFRLMIDIDLANQPFDGIGSYGHPFLAKLDGNGKTIKNALVQAPMSAANKNYMGLFNNLEGTVKDLTIENLTLGYLFYANASNGSEFSIGGFVGCLGAGGRVENVRLNTVNIYMTELHNTLNPIVVGGFAGICMNVGTSIENCSIEGINIDLTFASTVKKVYAHCGGMVGKLASGANVSLSYVKNASIKLNQSNMGTLNISSAFNNVGGFVGHVSGTSTIRQCFSNIDSKDVVVSVGSNNATRITNKIGGFVGEIQESNIVDCYTKNNFFAGLASTTKIQTTNYVGGFVGRAVVNDNLFATTETKVVLKTCYVIVSTATISNFAPANWGAVAGYLDAEAVGVANAGKPAFENVYYVAKNDQAINSVCNTKNGQYAGGGIDTLSNTVAKSLVNYRNFDEFVWNDDLSPTTNEGYPILRGVGNDMSIPNGGHSVTLQAADHDENNGLTPQTIAWFKVANGEEKNYQIPCPEGYKIEKIESQNGKVELLCDYSQNILKVYNATGQDVVTITFAKYFNVVANVAGVGGKIEFAPNYENIVLYEGTVEFVATADEGYRFAGENINVEGSCTTSVADNQITLSQITSDVELTVNFVKIYGVIARSNDSTKGLVTINDQEFAIAYSQSFDQGSSVTLKAKVLDTQLADCRFVGWYDSNGILITTSANHIVTNLQSDCEFEAVFAEVDKYSFLLNTGFADITYSIYKNGSSAATQENSFKATDRITVMLNIPNGYQFEGFYYDPDFKVSCGQNIDGLSINADTIMYAKTKALVELGATQNGYAVLNNDSSISSLWCYAGQQVTVQAFGDIGYQLLRFDGANVSNGMVVVDGAKTIVAVFESKPVSIQIGSTEQGYVLASVNGFPYSTGSTYKIGDVIDLNTVVNTVGYHFENYTGTFAGSLANQLSTTYTIVAEDAENGLIDIFANIVIDVFDVNISSNYGGMLSVYGDCTFEYGQVLVIEVDLYEMYRIVDISVNGVGGYTVNNDYQVSFNIIADSQIYFEFAPYLWWDVAEQPNGTGTEQDPYLITNAKELAFISYSINNGIAHDQGKVAYAEGYFKLECDIDLLGRFWTPIGTQSRRFQGVFDFNFKKVTNLYTIDDATLYKYGGLFNVIGKNGRIINQFKSYTTELLLVCGGSMLIALLIILVVVFEKHRRKPKRVVVLPTHLLNEQKNDVKPIKRPDLTKLNKK